MPSHLLVKVAEPDWPGLHVPEAVVDLFETNLELRKKVAGLHPAIPPAHAAVVAHEAALIMAVGQVDWDGPTDRVHRAVNVGTTPYEEVTVFFLNHPDALPQPPAE